MSYTRRMNDHVRLSCEKTLPHEIQQSKASSSPEKHDANLDPVVAGKGVQRVQWNPSQMQRFCVYNDI